MDEQTVFIIPGELYSSKNSRVVVAMKSSTTGKIKRVPLKSQAARNQEATLGIVFAGDAGFKKQWHDELAKHTMPYRLQIKIYRGRAGRFDYINMVQNLFDIMVKSAMIPDDDADTLIPVFVPYDIDRKKPRTELVIL